ncbi:MAG: hypothetical protein JWM90_504 [Thermoleophilia bacterium]|nr:hypothetical protein [Thermoleophilia bacterium]
MTIDIVRSMTTSIAAPRLPIPGGNPDAPMLENLTQRSLVRATFGGSQDTTWFESRLFRGQIRFTCTRDVSGSVDAMARPHVRNDQDTDLAERDYGFDNFLSVQGGTFDDAVQAAARLTRQSRGGSQAAAVIQATSGAFYVTPLGPVPTSLGANGTIPQGIDHDAFFGRNGTSDTKLEPRSMEGASEWQVTGSDRPGATPRDLPPSSWGGTLKGVRMHSVEALDPAIKAYVDANGLLDLRDSGTAKTRHG